MTVILYAIPVFMLLILLELAVDARRKTGHYRINDAITSLSIGVLSRMMTIASVMVPHCEK